METRWIFVFALFFVGFPVVVNFLHVVVVLQQVEQLLHLFCQLRVVDFSVGGRYLLDVCFHKGVALCFQRFTNRTYILKDDSCRNMKDSVGKIVIK